ncbi:hypothetical protein C266_23963 [Pandoraea sp. SD6-2]|nr:hypothetical protein C266_23963 [Pandoraea sp. SD6-2]
MRILEEFASQVLAYSWIAMSEIDSGNVFFGDLRKKIRQYGEVVEFLTIRRTARFAFSDAPVQ